MKLKLYLRYFLDLSFSFIGNVFILVGAFYGSFFYPTTHHRHSLSTVKLQQFQSCTDIHKYSCNLKTEVDFAKETTSLLSLM